MVLVPVRMGSYPSGIWCISMWKEPFICILNPEKIVLGGEITEKMTQHIKEQCCQCLPMGVMPEFALIPDSMEQYFMGLGQSALDLLDNQIRLH